MNKLTIDRLFSVADTGDCLLFKGSSIISKLIMRFTEYSHAAIIVKLQNSLYIVEATLPECELRDPFKAIADAKETYLFKPKWITETNRKCITKMALDTVATGTKYDVKSLFKNIIARTSIDAKAYFCSELVWDIWVNCGVAPLWILTAPRPGDIPRRVEGHLFKIVRED